MRLFKLNNLQKGLSLISIYDSGLLLGEYRAKINTICNEVFNEYAELRKKYQSETKEVMDSEQVSKWLIRIQGILKEDQE